jgi:uncharacterized membrane protein
MQWLQLVTRWLHVIAGAAWIGASFYFNWLNHSLRPPESVRPRVSGELWSVHGGGFYRFEKYDVAPEQLPARLHWTKWEAYFTWITGFALLVLVYYLGSGAYLRDPAVSEIGQAAAVSIGVGTLVAGWLVYEGICRSPLVERPLPLLIVLLAVVTTVAFGLGRVLSARAAFLHVGAMMGTWMAANVFFVIIPSQRAMVAAMEQGRPPDARKARDGARRSLHNNYLTLPVLFSMVGIHYPVVYAGEHAWLIMAAVSLIGVLARHYYNLRHRGRHVVWMLPAAAVAMVVLALATAPPRGLSPRETGQEATSAARRETGESFAVVRAIIEERCVTCHAAKPTHSTQAAGAPLGVVLDSPEQIRAQAERLGAAVAAGTMPLGNVTGMTPKERDLVVRWVREGARIE